MSMIMIVASVLSATDQPLQPTTEDQHKDRIMYAAFSPDSKQLATASWDKTVRIWNVEDCSLVRTLSAGEGELELQYYAVSYDHKGDRVAAISRRLGHSTILTLWDASAGERLNTLIGKEHNVSNGFSGMAFSPDDKEVFAVASRYAYFWNLEQQTTSDYFLTGHLNEGKAYYRDGHAIVVLGKEQMRAIDARTDRDIFLYRSLDMVWGDILKDGKFLALMYGGDFHVIDQRTGRVEKTFQSRNGKGHFCVLGPERESAIVMTDSGVIERWMLNDCTYAGRLEQGIRPASTNDKSIAFGTGKQPRIYGARHPTSLLISNDKKWICYVAGVQFALLPAKWNEEK